MIIPPLPQVERELVERFGLKEFIKLAWPLVEPADELQWNWHHDAMCDHVEAVLRGDLRNLLINVPPGFTKSIIVSVMAPAYAWTFRPDYRVLAIAYKDSLARRDSRKARNLLLSRWYQNRWPIELTKLDESRLENNKSGFRIIGSVRSGMTGERGNLALVDDPLSVKGADSPAERRQASEFFWDTLPTRLNDFKRDGKIVIMQRLHKGDTSGEILERAEDEWDTLILPNEYEPARCCVTSLGFRDPRTEEGELLHPARFGPEETAAMKGEGGLGGRVYAGQYQQRPSPKEGSVVKEAWLENRWRVRGTDPVMVVQSWDCASKPSERNDPSACLLAAVFADRVELWDYSCKRQEFPDLLRRAKDLYEAADPRPSSVLIEDKDAGQQLIQTLKRDKTVKMPIIAINPGSLDKMTRLDAETPFIEAGNLWLPDRAPWVAAFIDELTTVPAAVHDESADTVSQLLHWLRLRKPPIESPPPISIGKQSGAIR